MKTMFDAGVNCFTAWSKQKPMPNGIVFYNQFLGEFDPNMSADEANRRLDHVGKLTEEAQEEFKRGWEAARQCLNRASPTTTRDWRRWI